MDLSKLINVQQIIRLVRLFVVTFVGLLSPLPHVAVAAVVAAFEGAWRAVFPVVPGEKPLKGGKRETSL